MPQSLADNVRVDRVEELWSVLKSFADKGFTELYVKNPYTREVVWIDFDLRTLFKSRSKQIQRVEVTPSATPSTH